MYLKNRTQILTEQVLLQWFWWVQVHVVLLKDILEQLRPLREAAEQVQMCEMNYQLGGEPRVPTGPPERVRLTQKIAWEIRSLVIISTPFSQTAKEVSSIAYFWGHFFPPWQLRRGLSPVVQSKYFPPPQVYLSQIQTQNLHNIINKKYKFYQ